MAENIKILDGGYIHFIEASGHGEAGISYSAAIEDFKETVDMECGIIEAARQSTQANFRGWGEDEKLLRTLYLSDPQHSTPFEFSDMVIEVQAPIFVFREWHRHRTQSYNEMSARYAPMPNNNYLPTVERCMINSKTNKQAGVIKGADELTEDNCKTWLDRQIALYNLCEDHYQDGLKMGLPKEVARICIPVGRYSRMRAKANLRNWLAFMTLRYDPAAQWEIQRYAEVVGGLLREHFPRTWALYIEKKSPQFRISKFTDDQLITEIRKRKLSGAPLFHEEPA